MRLLVPLSALAIGIAAAAAGYNVMKRMHPSSGALGPLITLGEIQTVQGDVQVRLPKSVRTEPAKKSNPLYAQELLMTRAGSEAVLSFRSGASLRLMSDSRLVAEMDSNHPDVVIVTLLAGDLSVLSQGPSGKLRILQNGVDLPVQVGHLAAALPLIPMSALKSQVAVTGTTSRQVPPAGSVTPAISATMAEDAAAPHATPTKTLPPKTTATSNWARGKTVQTLTDSEISKQIKGQSSFFQRCYLSFVSRSQAQGASGQVIVGFKIQPSGKLTDTHVVHTDFKDPILQKCLTEVLERTAFRAFDGQAVVVQEFPIRLQ